MKRITIIGLILISVLISGCGIYGKGEATGYIYAVDDGLIWDKVWYKSSLASSESDCYLIKDNILKEQLRKLPSGTNVKIIYNRHFATVAACPEGTSTDDEIISFEVIE